MILEENPLAFFCHVHVSKTGGTSLNQLLEGWFPGSFEVLDHPDPAHVIEIQALSEFLSQRPTLNCISTHHLQAFPASIAGRKMHYFTILREPLDRAISVLTFMRKYSHEFTDEHKRTLPADFVQASELEILKQWTEKTASDRRAGRFAGNPVTAMFLGDGFCGDFLNRRRSNEAAAAAKCIAVLNRFLHVGDYACFEASVRELAQRIRALGGSSCEIDQVPQQRISRDIRGDLQWLKEGQAVVNAYMDGLMIDGMVYRHFAELNRRSAKSLNRVGGI